MIGSPHSARTYLRDADLRALFVEELGWDHHRAQPLAIEANGRSYALTAIAQKRGMVVYACAPEADGTIPLSATRRAIEKAVAKLTHEHIIVYIDAARARQVWQWVRREPGRPDACREHLYHRGQSGDALLQKLEHLAISIDEEDDLTIAGVAGRARRAFDVDRVTKRFYERFQAEHGAFLGFIAGIQSQVDRAWYASLMLNRLMFVYFIQKKGFLDGDTEYLRQRLTAMQQRRGKDSFHSFYRHFLLRLFHEGLGSQERSTELDELLGTVPYLNGGLFDVHELERANPAIEIPDDAFARVFDFFDAYQWHLDERPLRADNEINPDVLGYIFEKYINQKQMGAYYTKEDITEYIGKNTIIPYLLHAAASACTVAFRPDSALWRLLRDDPDRYIYPAMRHGVDEPLPAEIAAGLHDVARREGWNRPAAQGYALPTETWREHVARRTRCLDLRARLGAGEIHRIDDLITLNLDIRQFAEDVVSTSEGPELLRAVWQALQSVSVLDPTCGSGAFLFAALTILQPLYDACLDRMQGFVDDLDHAGRAVAGNGAAPAPHPQKYADFRTTLQRVADHANRAYFILKSIIIGNLYGVDIMPEAVEICKLRLFLKLVAQVERAEQIEPLPDIDFNVRAGNTLVGFASYDEVQTAVRGGLQMKMDLAGDMARIDEEAEIADRAYRQFRLQQTEQGQDVASFASAKRELRERLDRLRDELDRYLAAEYGIKDGDAAFAAWRASHQPFHWFVEFYGTMKSGGFDVIIGNPPWKEYAAVRKDYKVRDYATESCGNLHGICTERALNLRSSRGTTSFIVQLPLSNSSRMGVVRDVLKQRSNALYIMSFDDRPGKLFEGLQHCRSTIFLSRAANTPGLSAIATTRYQRWPTSTRPDLFAQIEYAALLEAPIFAGHFPKYANDLQESLFRKVNAHRVNVVGSLIHRAATPHFIFYQEATQYWVKASIGLPYYAKNGALSAPAHGRYLYFQQPAAAQIICALLNSSLFYTYFIAYGDCFHLSDGLVTGFPLAPSVGGDTELNGLCEQLMADLTANAERKTIRTSDGHQISYAEFYGSKSKPIIDEIDRVLARHYGFTDEELDFIINYDIKYRMGQDAEDGE